MTGGPGALVLVVEDEPDIRDILQAYLARNGLRSAYAENGRRALEQHLALKPDLVLLDVQLPLLDGWQVLSELRRRGDTPVIMVTALDQDLDKLTGLRIGADDYVVKPFNPVEVIARVLAVLRRAKPRDHKTTRRILNVSTLTIDLDSYDVTVSVDQELRPLSLTLTEFKLLVHLAQSPRRVCSRAELMVSCLPEGDAMERTVDSHISKLRKKLEDLGVEGLITSIRGVGYRFEASA